MQGLLSPFGDTTALIETTRNLVTVIEGRDKTLPVCLEICLV